jgi:hypothetical protein
MNQRTYYSEEAKHRVRRDTTLMISVFLALGISIGTALAMLFAPKSGNETREDIAEATDGAVKKLESKFNEFRKEVESRFAS